MPLTARTSRFRASQVRKVRMIRLRLPFALAFIAFSIPTAALARDPRDEPTPSGHGHSRIGMHMPPQFVAVQAGYGLSSAYHDDRPDGEGIFAQGEYILILSEGSARAHTRER